MVSWTYDNIICAIPTNHLSEALKLIKKINRDPAKAPQLIREYEMLYGLTEVLIEAAPTILILVVMQSGHPRHKTLKQKYKKNNIQGVQRNCLHLSLKVNCASPECPIFKWSIYFSLWTKIVTKNDIKH